MAVLFLLSVIKAISSGVIDECFVENQAAGGAAAMRHASQLARARNIKANQAPSLLILRLLMHQLMQIRKLIQFFTFFILFHFILMDIN